RPIAGSVRDIAWFTAEAAEMEPKHWDEASSAVVGLFLAGEGFVTPGPHGEAIVDDSFYLLFNAHHEPVKFRMPPEEWGTSWRMVLDTGRGFLPEAEAPRIEAGGELEVAARA